MLKEQRVAEQSDPRSPNAAMQGEELFLSMGKMKTMICMNMRMSIWSLHAAFFKLVILTKKALCLSSS